MYSQNLVRLFTFRDPPFREKKADDTLGKYCKRLRYAVQFICLCSLGHLVNGLIQQPVDRHQAFRRRDNIHIYLDIGYVCWIKKFPECYLVHGSS